MYTWLPLPEYTRTLHAYATRAVRKYAAALTYRNIVVGRVLLDDSAVYK